MFQPTSPENAAVISRIEALLVAAPLGGTILYSSINAAAKRNVQVHGRWMLAKAMENSEKALNCVFSSIRNVGIQRLPSDEIPGVGLAALRRIRSTAKRGKKRIDRANTNSMPEGDRRRIVGYSAMLGAVALIADGRKASAIATVADPVKPIPPGNILDMFRTGP